MKTPMNANANRAGFCSVQASSFFTAAAAWLAAFLLSACLGAQAADPAAPEAASRPGMPSELRLQPGDQVKITFDSSTNLNTVVKVQLDGNVTLQTIGDVKVLNKTTAELRTELMDRYSKVLKGEDITVAMVNANNAVYVSGAVLRPGRLPMDRPMSVMDAIMEAGGMDNSKAKPSGVVVFRVEDGKHKSFKVDMRKVLSGRAKDAFFLKPFDTVHVPEKTFNF